MQQRLNFVYCCAFFYALLCGLSISPLNNSKLPIKIVKCGQ